MKLISLVLGAAILAGCASADPYRDKQIIVKTQYITRTASDQQKNIPPYPDAIDVNTASQLDLAEWIKQSEQRQWDLESIIRELIVFYEKPFVDTATPAASPTGTPAPATPEPKGLLKIGR